MNTAVSKIRSYVGDAKLKRLIVFQCAHNDIANVASMPTVKFLSAEGVKNNQALLDHAIPILDIKKSAHVDIVTAPGSVNSINADMVFRNFIKTISLCKRLSDRLAKCSDPVMSFRELVRVIKGYMTKTEVLIMIADHDFWLDAVVASDMFSDDLVKKLSEATSNPIIIDANVVVADGLIDVSDVKVIRVPK